MQKHKHDSKKQASIALKKAQTHISKILQMIEEDRYCMEILQQMLAVNGLVKSSADNILTNHLQTCFVEGLRTEDKNRREELVQEIIGVISLANKKP